MGDFGRHQTLGHFVTYMNTVIFYYNYCLLAECGRVENSYFYIEKWTFKVMCEVYYRAKRDKKGAT